ncbi:hypothetical protein [Paenibacillus sp. JCM 10914]|uniref:hypothetical protein n=1 Tax=Paenibacillus sp. JCM 10914 TaxID=1236974 RepID=UPI000B329465|nr:hypothetical protein [Paenibacillus sp. JCM 10914]
MTSRSTPKNLLNKYATNRFVKPSDLSPLAIKRIEIAMLELAQTAGFTPVLLSPASLLGSCSVMAEVDQNHVVSAVRGVELMADSTNMLAIYLADGIKHGTIDNANGAIHLSATCRATRAQLYKSSKALPHFGLFTLVSSGKDRGSYGFEKEAMAKHVEYYVRYFGERFGQKLQVTLNLRKGYTDGSGFVDRMSARLQAIYPDVEWVVNKEATDNSYYKGLNFKISLNGQEFVDGGLVDWSQKLLGNPKERLCISGTGIDMQVMSDVPVLE